MTVKIESVRLSKFGIPALLIRSEYQQTLYRVLEGYLVLPEDPQDGSETVRRLYRLTMPYPPGAVGVGLEESFEVMKIAATEGGLHQASKFVNTATPPDDFVAHPVDSVTLRAWRSLNLFPAFQRMAGFDEATAIELSHMAQPLNFIQ